MSGRRPNRSFLLRCSSRGNPSRRGFSALSRADMLRPELDRSVGLTGRMRHRFQTAVPASAALALLLTAAGCVETPAPAPTKETTGAAAAADPFTPELRARVDRMKQEIATTPTSAENVYARVDVLWDWANAFALEGGDLPINLPVDVAIVRWGQADGKGPTSPWSRTST